MRISWKNALVVSALALLVPIAAYSEKPKGENSANPVERNTVKGSKKVAEGTKDTGKMAGDGAVEAGKGIKKGASWLVRPWSKNQGARARSRR